MEMADFLRLYPMRAPNLMWFLGAGASAAAGIASAYHMIQDFKRTLFCAAERVSIRSYPDLDSPFLQARLQQYFDNLAGHPPQGSPEEYASYFALAYPAEADRRTYIERAVSGAVPSYGHLAVAALMKLDKARIIWTTNFDRMVEDAALRFYESSGRIVMVALNNPQLARQAMNEGRWPIIVKLHGDFQSRSLKNTATELRAPDVTLRHSLVEACGRYGLIVVGYSGRDESVMDALEAAIGEGSGYPAGLFWLHRPDYPCLPRVTQLIDKAQASGIDAHIIGIETFDEVLGDIIRLLADVPEDVLQLLRNQAPRVSDAPVPELRGHYPVIRLNALPILSAPTACRRVVCTIGGTREVKDAVIEAGALALAMRRRVGVIAFGSDGEVRRAFEPYGITDFGLHSIEPHQLRYESAELGLLYDAFAGAISRERPVQVARKAAAYVAYVETDRSGDPQFDALRRATGSLHGSVPKTDIQWTEACRFRVEFHLDQLWLLLEPTIWLDRVDADTDGDSSPAGEFVRERLARRYNAQFNAVLEGWIHLLCGGLNSATLRTYGIGDGVDASFTISSHTAFSYRRFEQ